MTKEEFFRKIPKVDTLLKEEEIKELCEEYGRGAVVDAIRSVLDKVRQNAKYVGYGSLAMLDGIGVQIAEKVRKSEEPNIRKVFNATGIILHTNLGRAPLGKAQREAVLETFGGYANLEYNLETGKRGKRWEHYAEQISEVTGSGGAIAVNNNAAAVTLILSALTKGKEVIVSRGELIEIGGRFRIPEVMEQSGAVLKETGCTNRTRISDYEKAINENTGALLKVHTSNYKIMGFTEEVSVEELSELGKKYNLPVIVDLGSGVLMNLEKYGLPHEPTVQETLKKGADLVCFSGDKLLGGPQAGIIAGKKEYIKAMENHPLMRAFRLDKCTIAALEATFREYKDETRAEKNIPVLHMISTPLDELKERAEKMANDLNLCVNGKQNGKTEELAETVCPTFLIEESQAMLGGGSMPTEGMKSYAVAILPEGESCEALAARMRHLPIPVIAHIKNEKVLLDMRTIAEEELDPLTEELKHLWR